MRTFSKQDEDDMATPVMDKRRRALQLWSLLILAAKTQTVLSYWMVSRMTGLAMTIPNRLDTPASTA